MSSVRKQYPFDLVEPKWQAYWSKNQTFHAWNPGESIPVNHPFVRRHPVASRELPPKYYVLDMFPYPSGAGLHVGHPEGYTATDIISRYRRALGYNVLHPMGWDAFGLPAEQYAIKTGQHPRATTEANIANFKRQIQSLGFSYDWQREVDTTHPRYFRWTQWIFLQLYNSWFNPRANKAQSIETLTYPPEIQGEQEKRAYRDRKRLAYVSEAPVNWCPELGTVLANEEVIEGKSEVGGYPVIRKPMRQWMLRITAYAERLLQDLDGIDWTESLKEMQRNWIGRSEGAEVVFKIADCGPTTDACNCEITVFTTRPDTLFGATYMVLSPEHKLVDQIVPSLWPENTPDSWKGSDANGKSCPREAVQMYRHFAASKSDLERTELAKEKTGVFTGAYAINPVNGERIPIWIADYVLASYGTGAIMAVPAHDTRDLEFARKFGMAIRVVVEAAKPEESIGFVGDGTSVSSGFLSGLPTPEAKKQIGDWLESRGVGKTTVNYKLRDWLFSRQRYWGEPFPIIWREGHHEALPESALPLQPPVLNDYKPTSSGEPPLTRAADWVRLSDGAVRETNTMPQWAGSCWYYLRYLDACNAGTFCSPEAEQYWMAPEGRATANDNPADAGRKLAPGVDLYVGGTEHAVLHLLYARFWHKVLFDLNHVSTPEPFFKLVNQGLILGELEYTAFFDSQENAVSTTLLTELAEEATGQGPRMVGSHKTTGEKLVGRRVQEDEVEKAGDGFSLKGRLDIRVDARCCKMSKSRGNVINPDDILKEYGADAFRLYEMFMGPLEMVKPWNTKGVEGVYKFLGRVWRLFVDEQSKVEFEQSLSMETGSAGDLLARIQCNPAIQDVDATPAQMKTLHACIKKVTDDLDHMRFNTAISALMVFVNEAMTWKVLPRLVMGEFLILLQPFAPHLAEELFTKLQGLNDEDTMAYLPWPVFDEKYLVESTIELPIQINGKLRDRVVVSVDATPAQIEAAALAKEGLKPFLEGKTIKKVIVVPRKVVNIAVA